MPQPGDEYWYMGVFCHKCKMPMMIFADQSNGTKRVDFRSHFPQPVPCGNQHCRHVGTYQLREVMQFRAILRGPYETEPG